MGDLKSPLAIKLKGMLFLFLGLLASVVLIAEQPSLRIAFLLAVAIWSFCRFYYFAFYVIEHYVDSEFRFAGLISFAQYLWRNRKIQVVPQITRHPTDAAIDNGRHANQESVP